MATTDGASSPLGPSSRGRSIASDGRSTGSSRVRAPSQSASKSPLYMWCQFWPEHLPYHQDHVLSLLAIFYACNTNEDESQDLSESQKLYLLDPGLHYPCDIDKSINYKPRYTAHHKPFFLLAESVLLAAMKECKWDMWEAYDALLRYGRTGYYRNTRFPSWKREVSVNDSFSEASKIFVPEDVIYRTVAALFGWWGLEMEPTTSLERHQARNQIREARRAERDMLEGEEVGDYLSDSQSDDDRHYMDDETRDPSHVPAQISKGCRGDCLNYVRSLAYHQVSNHLVKRVSQAVNDAEAAVEKCERHLKELRTNESCLSISRRFRQSDGSTLQEDDFTRKTREKQKLQFAKDLKDMNKAINRYRKADIVVNPRTSEDEWLEDHCSQLQELSAKYDQRMQIDARGDPAMLKSLSLFRKSAEFSVQSRGPVADLEEQDLPEQSPTYDDRDDYMTAMGCISDPAYEPSETEIRPTGLALYGLTDRHTPYQLAGIPTNTWPGINKSDPVYGTKDHPVSIIPRRHCCEGAVEVVSRAFQHNKRSQDPNAMMKDDWNTDYSRGCIIGDATGMGKTAQAMQIIGLVGHLAVRFRDVDDSDATSTTFPPLMLADRQAFHDALNADVESDPHEYQPGESIRKYMSDVAPAGKAAIGTFAHTSRIAPPCRPSIIVAPPALTGHWKRETSRFAGDHLLVVQIMDQRSAASTLAFVYRTQRIWDEAMKSGADTSDLQIPSDIVVLISTNLLGRIWSDRKRRLKEERELPLSVYDLDFAVMIIDEVHLVKGRGILQTASHHLAKRAAFTIGQSATPLVNSPLDLCFVANALDFPQAMNVANPEYFDPGASLTAAPTIPHFFKEARLHLGHQRLLDRSGMTETMRLFYESQEQPIGGTRPKTYLSEPISKARSLADLQNALPNPIRLDPSYVQASRNVFGLFGPYLMRRGKYAVHPTGERMLNLGPLHEMIVNVELREDEIEHIKEYLEMVCQKRMETLGADRDYRDSPGYYGTTYMAAKAATIAPWYFVRGLPRSSDESSKTITPTKLGAVFDLINYHTRQDEINKVSLADRKKFVIHCDSREIEPAFIYELRARGMSARFFDGMTTEGERRRIERDINKDEDHSATKFEKDSASEKTRILFCTPVAGLGLNLYRTNVVINLTMPWSQFLYDQRLGRHHRTPADPSKKPLPVYVYTILAINSVDLVMYSASALKSRLDITTFRHPSNHEIQGLLQPEENVGARKRRVLTHILPNRPKYQLPKHLKAIDYPSNPNLVVTQPQFDSLRQLKSLDTLKYLHLCSTKLDALIVPVALGVAQMDEAVADHAEVEPSIVTDLVDQGYIPAEMAINAEKETKKSDLFRKQVLVAAVCGRLASGHLETQVVLSKEKIEAAEKANYAEWERSLVEETAALKANELEKLRLFEDKVWALLRSTSKPLAVRLRPRLKEFQALIPERNRLASVLCYVDVFEIPDHIADLITWAERALHFKELVTLPLMMRKEPEWTAEPTREVVARRPNPTPPQPLLFRPPIALARAAQLAEGAGPSARPTQLGPTTMPMPLPTSNELPAETINHRITLPSGSSARPSSPAPAERRNPQSRSALSADLTRRKHASSGAINPYLERAPAPSSPPLNSRSNRMHEFTRIFRGDMPVVTYNERWVSNQRVDTTMERLFTPESLETEDQRSTSHAPTRQSRPRGRRPKRSTTARSIPALEPDPQDPASASIDCPRIRSLDSLFASDHESEDEVENEDEEDQESREDLRVDSPYPPFSVTSGQFDDEDELEREEDEGQLDPLVLRPPPGAIPIDTQELLEKGNKDTKSRHRMEAESSRKRKLSPPVEEADRNVRSRNEASESIPRDESASTPRVDMDARSEDHAVDIPQVAVGTGSDSRSIRSASEEWAGWTDYGAARRQSQGQPLQREVEVDDPLEETAPHPNDTRSESQAGSLDNFDISAIVTRNLSIQHIPVDDIPPEERGPGPKNPPSEHEERQDESGLDQIVNRNLSNQQIPDDDAPPVETGLETEWPPSDFEGSEDGSDWVEKLVARHSSRKPLADDVPSADTGPVFIGRIIGHTHMLEGSIGYKQIMYYLCQDFGHSPSEAVWLRNNHCRQYPVQEYLDYLASHSDKKLKDSHAHTVESVRRWWDERGKLRTVPLEEGETSSAGM